MNDHLPHPLDPAELLAQRAWMRRFAAALAGTEGEDLVQEVWVRALGERAPTLARPRAWLASVLRNAARMRTRGAVRREQREAQAARAEALDSTDELVAQAELEQLAVRAVLALAEPYRQAMLLRYVRGLEPSEIARQLELPPSTVRNRIARGLAEVREELDRRHGRREAWVALLVPEAVVQGGAAAAVVVGGIWMSAKWIAGAAAVAVAAAWLWGDRSGRGHVLPAPEASATSASELAIPASVARALVNPSQAQAAQRQALPASESYASSVATELLVQVTWARDGSPAADVALFVESSDVEPYELTTTFTTDASGTARITGLPPGLQFVDTMRDASGSVELVPGEPETLELAIPLALDVYCRVVDREGAGVVGAEVWLSDFGDTSSGIVVGRTNVDGRVLLRDLPCQHRSLAARAAGHAPSPQREFRGPAGWHIEAEFVLPGPGASLAGVVQDADGIPLAGAEVQIGAQVPDGVESEDGYIYSAAPPRRVTCAEDGSFLVHGLAPGLLEVQARAPGYGTAHAEVELATDETGYRTLVLPPEARVVGVARDGSGCPLAGVHITGDSSYFHGRETRTAADGSFVLHGLEAGLCWLSAHGGSRGRARSERQLSAGEEARWDIVLTAGGVVAGVVLDERGAPLSNWHVAAVAPGETGQWQSSAYSDAAGRFRMEDCPAQRFVLELHAPEEEWGNPVLVFEDFQVGDETLVLRALDACRPSAFIVGRLVDADGAPVLEAELGNFGLREGHTYVTDADGRFRMGPLRPGEYWLHAEAPGPLEGHAPEFALQAGETKDVGNLVLERCGWLRVRAVAKGGGELPAGTVLEDVQLELRGEEGMGRWIFFDDLQGRTGPIGVGTYLIRTGEGAWRAVETEVEVRPGATTELELEFEPASD